MKYEEKRPKKSVERRRATAEDRREKRPASDIHLLHFSITGHTAIDQRKYDPLSPREITISEQGTSREEIKLAERMASILKDFEARQLEVDEDEKLEVMEEEEEDWDPQDELMDVERQASSWHMIAFSGGTLVSEERMDSHCPMRHFELLCQLTCRLPTIDTKKME
ncbi:unnamed protein product [Heligmosomoides polygyrus]|uniref:DRY_EERY domain-containing protein n=1 Tax=Heligmosomoides polygyrus TaxID=6339 RepID=A0A183FGS8_HELPZ|nr:unnamed protein product [Heligmosomoides polygyrus]